MKWMKMKKTAKKNFLDKLSSISLFCNQSLQRSYEFYQFFVAQKVMKKGKIFKVGPYEMNEIEEKSEKVFFCNCHQLSSMVINIIILLSVIIETIWISSIILVTWKIVKKETKVEERPYEMNENEENSKKEFSWQIVINCDQYHYFSISHCRVHMNFINFLWLKKSWKKKNIQRGTIWNEWNWRKERKSIFL